MSTPFSSMVEARHLSKRYGERVVLDDVSLSVAPQETLAIIGPSGCGKSTLLRLLAGLESPDSGDVTLADNNLSLVFQYSALFDSLSVFENVAFSLLEKPDYLSERSRPQYTHQELKVMVDEKLRTFGLGDIAHLFPNQLSGGMQKRVSFARAIMNNPKLILYDEPTAGLDPIASTMVENYIAMLQKTMGATSLIVTHNLSTIHRICDKACLLFEGKIRWYGPAKEFFTTDNPYARQFASATLDGPMTAVHD